MHKKPDDLSISVGSLNGVGPKTLSLLRHIGINSIFDLLSNVPKELCDKSETLSMKSINHGDRVVVSGEIIKACLLYTSPSPRDATLSRMPSSA